MLIMLSGQLQVSIGRYPERVPPYAPDMTQTLSASIASVVPKECVQTYSVRAVTLSGGNSHREATCIVACSPALPCSQTATPAGSPRCSYWRCCRPRALATQAPLPRLRR